MSSEDLDSLYAEREEILSHINSLENAGDTSFFDDFVDQTESEVEILGHSFSPSYVLKTIDPVAYKEAYRDFIDTELSTLEDELAAVEDQIREHSDVSEDPVGVSNAVNE